MAESTQTNPIDPRLYNKFESSEYPTIKHFMYPSDLFSSTNVYGGNYVIFYINALEDSTLIGGEPATTAINPNATPRDFSDSNGLNESTSNIFSRVSSGLQAGIITYGAARSSLELNKVLSFGAGAAAGLIAQEEFIESIGGAKQEYKRLNTAIALYIPNELSVRYSSQWESQSLALELAFGESGQTLLNSDIKGTVNTASAYLSGLTLKGPGGDLAAKMSKTAANPKKEQLFREVDFRTFTFNYQFFAKSKEEANNIKNIIEQFKFHMHPEFRKDTNQFLYMYPSQFDISYYNNGVENKYLHKHVSCALTDVSINYTQQATFSTFDDGMPTAITMSLTFKELAVLSKERIREGF